MKRPHHSAVTVGLIAFALRMIYCALAVWVFDKAPPGGQRHDGYLEIAQSLATGEGYRLEGELNFFRPPTYVLFLVPWAMLPGSYYWIMLVQSAIGAATCALVTLLGRNFTTARWAWWAGIVLAICPWHVHVTTNPMTPVLASFLMMTLLWFWPMQAGRQWGRSAVCGLNFGLLALCHPSSVLIGPGWVGLQVWRGRRSNRFGQALVEVSLFCVLAGVTIAPWMIRNTVVGGKAIPLSNSAGFQYFVAEDMITTAPTVWSHPVHGIFPGLEKAESYLQSQGITPSKNLKRFKGVTLEEGEIFDAWMKANLRDHPAGLGRRLFMQGWWFWFGDRPKWLFLHLAFKLPLLILGIVGAFRGLRRKLPLGPLLGSVLAIWSIHALIMGYLPLAGYSLVIIGPLCILAAIGISPVPAVSDSCQSAPVGSKSAGP